MSQEEILKKHIEGRRSTKDNELLAAASLITANEAKELADASMLVAKTTQEYNDVFSKNNEMSADRLAKTTQESAERLAKETERSAELLRKSSSTSERRIIWLTIAVIAVGVMHVTVVLVDIFIRLRTE